MCWCCAQLSRQGALGSPFLHVDGGFAEGNVVYIEKKLGLHTDIVFCYVK